MTVGRFTAIAIALVLGSASPALADDKAPDSAASWNDADEDAAMVKAFRLVQSGKPGEAVKIFDQVIAAYEKDADPKANYRCGGSGNGGVGGLIDAAIKDPDKSAYLVNPNWCAALFGKGYALIDLGRASEAGPFLAKAVEMEPTNPTYINEYAEWFKSRREWQKSYDLFDQAWQATSQDPHGADRRPAARALRGMAFNLIEMNRLDDAEKLLKQSLKFEPEAKDKVQGELDYIASMRRRK